MKTEKDYKEKAKELVDKFLSYQVWHEFDEDGNREARAKQCALICVNFTKQRFEVYKGMRDQEFFDAEVNALEKVKQEIEKL